jgi:hypothetical protein
VIHLGGTVHVAGCPADVSHGTVRVIDIEVIAPPIRTALARSGIVWRQQLEPVAHLDETNEVMIQADDV